MSENPYIEYMNTISSLQSEVERLKKENSKLKVWHQNDIKSIERLKSSVSNEGVKELLKKQREICQRIYDAEKSGLIDAVIGNVYANAPEPSFEVEEKKEDTLNKE